MSRSNSSRRAVRGAIAHLAVAAALVSAAPGFARQAAVPPEASGARQAPQEPGSPAEKRPSNEGEAPRRTGGQPAERAPDDGAKRIELNLLGKTDAAAGESRRNENIQFNLVDNNALKELNIRLG